MNRILTLCFVLVSTVGFAQKTVRIKDAVGRQQIVGNITEEVAKSKAIVQAKIDALRKAGVSEHIQSYEMLYKGEIGSKFDEVFMSDMLSEIRGAVKGYEVKSVNRGIDEHQNFYIEVVIDANVVLYDKGNDPAFQVNIDGIKQGYENGEMMTYSIVPTKDCYLNIFNLYENNASLIYPNQYEKNQQFKAGEKVKFPFTSLMEGYTLERSTSQPEKNKLLFVFTKDNIPFIKFKLNQEGDQVTSFEDISAWMFSISPDERVNYFIQFVIY